MRKHLLATAAIAVVATATPAAAKDGSWYAGLEAGIMFPKDNDADALVNYTTTTAATPAPLPASAPLGLPAAPADTTFNNAFGIDYKNGWDADLIAGYDFGMFRIEGELGYKHAKLNDFEFDNSDIAAINAALNRPSVAPDTGAPGLPALSAADFDLSGHANVWSGMINALLDLGGNDGIGGYVGLGFGYSGVKVLGEHDNAFAWQLLAGVYYPVSPNIDIGLKYRYFRTGSLNFGEGADTTFALAGNPNTFNVGSIAPVFVDQTTNALVTTDFEDHFSSHSLLLSLVYNFGAAPPPPPPPPPPATQTCPDGSVILATDTCPAPPPPPPPPAPAPERGM